MNKKTIAYIATSCLCLALLIVIITAGARFMGDKYKEESVQGCENTVRSYAVQCYALEGSFPETLEYLTENYTLTLNKDYVYHYNFIGSNMMPDITVFPID